MMAFDRRIVLAALAAGAGGTLAIRNLMAQPSAPGPSVSPALPAARPNLYNCEGCEAVGERRATTLAATVDLAGPDEPGERMILTGRVLTADGSAPAAGVVIYAHHTNHDGLYANGSNESMWSRRHGRCAAGRAPARTGDIPSTRSNPPPTPTGRCRHMSTCSSANRGGRPIISTTSSSRVSSG
ncbi:hypothetical protein DdX_21198 [Ditylenchus destructor]|uniref:Uncharacterized protein n=1 Tax=Ditylenchus destructor TaxID=166010 RepID=A0AAD4MGV2_9BILA|nr:hypothetical protein DdX_21198 [Ditylenchus destructor]